MNVSLARLYNDLYNMYLRVHVCTVLCLIFHKRFFRYLWHHKLLIILDLTFFISTRFESSSGQHVNMINLYCESNGKIVGPNEFIAPSEYRWAQ